MEMVRVLRQFRISGLFLALLVFWGMSGRSISASFCPMLRGENSSPATTSAKDHDCCAGKEETKIPPKKSKDGCCCKQDLLKSLPGKTFSIDQGSPVITALPRIPIELFESILEEAETIHFYS